MAKAMIEESEMRKPAVRHKEQKMRSGPWQSSKVGKGVQVFEMEEQREWRP